MNRFANIQVKTMRSTLAPTNESRKRAESTVVQVQRHTILSYLKVTICCLYMTFLLTIEYLQEFIVEALIEYYTISIIHLALLDSVYVLIEKLALILASIFICELGVRAVMISGCFITLSGYFSTIFVSHFISLYFTYSTLLSMGYSLIKSTIIATCIYTPKRYKILYLYSIYVPGVTLSAHISKMLFAGPINVRTKDGKIGERWRSGVMKLTPLFVVGIALGCLLDPLGAKVEYMNRIDELLEKGFGRSIERDRTNMEIESIPEELPLDYHIWTDEKPINFFEILDLPRLKYKPYYLLVMNAFLIGPLDLMTTFFLRNKIALASNNQTEAFKPIFITAEFSSSLVISILAGFLHDQYIHFLMVNAIFFQVLAIILTAILTTTENVFAVNILLDLQRIIIFLSNITASIITVDITGWSYAISGYFHLCFAFGSSEIILAYFLHVYGTRVDPRTVYTVCIFSEGIGTTLILYSAYLQYEERKVKIMQEEQLRALNRDKNLSEEYV